MKVGYLFASLALFSGCAFDRPDHFYLLDAAHLGNLQPRNSFAAQVTLRVTLPSLVDRSEMVLMHAAGVQILEHERWAAPLDDQFTAVLGQDIEARREDVILSSRRIAEPGAPLETIDVDVVQLSLRKNSGVLLEVRWRLEDARTAKVSQGRETFMSPVEDGNLATLVRSLDACIGELADRLVADLPT